MPEKTLAEMRREGERLFVNCSRPDCFRTAEVDLAMLIEKLGEDHGAMHADLVGKFACTACREAGRDQRPVFFTYLPDYAADRARANAKWDKPRSG